MQGKILKSPKQLSHREVTAPCTTVLGQASPGLHHHAMQASKASGKTLDDSPVKESSTGSEAGNKSQDDWSVVEGLHAIKAGSNTHGDMPVNNGPTAAEAGSKSQHDGSVVQRLGAMKAGSKVQGAEPIKQAQDEWGRDLQPTLDTVPHVDKPNQVPPPDAVLKDTAQKPSVMTKSAQNRTPDSTKPLAGAAAAIGTATFAVSKAVPTPAPAATGNSSSAPSATTDTATSAVPAAAGGSGESAAPKAAEAATYRTASPVADVTAPAASAATSGSFPVTVADRAAAAAAMMEADESAKAFPAAAFVAADTAADTAAGKDDSFDVEVMVELPDDKTDVDQDTGRVRVTVNAPDDSKQSLPISVVITGSDDADDSESGAVANFDWHYGYDSD